MPKVLSAIAARKARGTVQETSLSVPSATAAKESRTREELALKEDVRMNTPASSRSGSRTHKVRQREDKVLKRSGEPEKTNGKKQKQEQRYYATEIVGGPSTTPSESEPSENGVRGQSDEVEAEGEAPLTFDFGSEGEAVTGRPKKRRRVDTGPMVSSFEPINGINICKVTAEQLETARQKSGLADDTVLAKRGVIVSLAADENLILSGTCVVTPLQRSLHVFSSRLIPAAVPPCPLYAPLTHPLPVLQGDDVTDIVPPSSLLSHLDIPQPLVETDRTVFMLQELNSGIQGMDRAVLGLGKIWPQGKSVFGLRGCHPIIRSHPVPVYTHQTSSNWESALTKLSQASKSDSDGQLETFQDDENRSMPLIAMVKGPKRSGKSTFAREAVNRLLERYEKVAYLDCDLGQSEFSCGGMVELHVVDQPLLGPSFTHPAQALCSHFIGSLTPALCADGYIASIAALVEHYRFEVQYPISSGTREYQDRGKITEVVPLVVNTQGWVKGLGADLLGQIEELVEATHTFAFQADDAVARDAEQDGTSYSTALPEEACGFGQVVTVSSAQATPLLSKYTAAEFRILATLSYMHSIPPQGLASGIRSRWVFDHPLVRQAPWQVDMAAIREIYLTGEGADGVIEEDLALALNGSIVALLERTAASSDVPDQRYVPGREIPSAADTNCLGLAVLRSVSPDLQTVHLLSPVDPASLSRVSIMIKGELELPVTAMLDWQAGPTVDSVGMMGLKWEDVPFLQFKGVDGIGMGRRKWRRNIMRKGQVA